MIGEIGDGCFTEIVKRADVRVIERRHGTRFRLEPGVGNRVGGDVRRVPIPRLQEELEESSALGRPPRALERGFGVAHDTSDAPRERTSFDRGGADADDERAVLLERALAQLDTGAPGEAEGHLYLRPLTVWGSSPFLLPFPTDQRAVAEWFIGEVERARSALRPSGR